MPKNLQKPAVLQEAFDILEQGNWTIKELEAYTRDRDALWSEQSRLDTAAKEGREEAIQEIVKNILLKNTMSIEDIAQVTGLRIEQINQIKNKKE